MFETSLVGWGTYLDLSTDTLRPLNRERYALLQFTILPYQTKLAYPGAVGFILRN